VDIHTLNQIKIYRWEGQSSAFNLYSACANSFSRAVWQFFFKRETVAEFNPAPLSGILARALLLSGYKASYTFQMLISLSKSSYSSEIFITLILILVSIGLGIIANCPMHQR